MSDFIDLPPGLVIALLLVFALVLSIFIVKAEDREVERFQQRCILAGETPAKCAILAELKRSSDDAAIMAAGAMGSAASASGRR